MNSVNRIIVIGLICLLLSSGLAYELYTISSIQSEVNNFTVSADEHIGSDSRAKNIAFLRENFKTELSTIDEVVLTRSDLVSLVDKLEKTGRDLGLIVSISSITNDSKTPSSTSPETVRISIESRGPWAGNLSYIRLIENLPHKFSIDRVDLTQNEQDWKTAVSLKIVTYPEK